MDFSQLKNRVDPSNWSVISNDGTNIVARNSKANLDFSGPVSEFNAMLAVRMPSDDNMVPEFDSLGRFVGIKLKGNGMRMVSDGVAGFVSKQVARNEGVVGIANDVIYTIVEDDAYRAYKDIEFRQIDPATNTPVSFDGASLSSATGYVTTGVIPGPASSFTSNYLNNEKGSLSFSDSSLNSVFSFQGSFDFAANSVTVPTTTLELHSLSVSLFSQCVHFYSTSSDDIFVPSVVLSATAPFTQANWVALNQTPIEILVNYDDNNSSAYVFAVSNLPAGATVTKATVGDSHTIDITLNSETLTVTIDTTGQTLPAPGVNLQILLYCGSLTVTEPTIGGTGPYSAVKLLKYTFTLPDHVKIGALTWVDFILYGSTSYDVVVHKIDGTVRSHYRGARIYAYDRFTGEVVGKAYSEAFGEVYNCDAVAVGEDLYFVTGNNNSLGLDYAPYGWVFDLFKLSYSKTTGLKVTYLNTLGSDDRWHSIATDGTHLYVTGADRGVNYENTIKLLKVSLDGEIIASVSLSDVLTVTTNVRFPEVEVLDDKIAVSFVDYGNFNISFFNKQTLAYITQATIHQIDADMFGYTFDNTRDCDVYKIAANRLLVHVVELENNSSALILTDDVGTVLHKTFVAGSSGYPNQTSVVRYPGDPTRFKIISLIRGTSEVKFADMRIQSDKIVIENNRRSYDLGHLATFLFAPQPVDKTLYVLAGENLNTMSTLQAIPFGVETEAV